MRLSTWTQEAKPMTTQEILAGLGSDVAKWREQLASMPDGAGFDTQATMISAWLKEGQRLLDRLEP
jgi:hypothetical protein